MVDRVAAAIHGVYGIMIPFSALDERSELKKRLRTQAIVAIAAMRDPTPEISNISTMSIYYGADEIWRMMIDALVEAKLEAA